MDIYFKLDKVLDVKYKNGFTIQAKEKLSKSTYQLCRDMSERIATAEDNSEKLDLYIKKQDYLRNISIDNYFNFTENFSKNN